MREQKPIHARPAGRLLRSKRWAQRNPVVATSLLAVLILLSGGLGMALTHNQELAEQLNHRRAAGLIAASRDVGEAHSLESLQLAEAGYRKDPSSEEAFTQLHAAASEQRERQRLSHLVANILSVEFSPDGRQALTASGAHAFLWDAETGRPVRRFDHSPVTKGFTNDIQWAGQGTIGIVARITPATFHQNAGSEWIGGATTPFYMNQIPSGRD